MLALTVTITDPLGIHALVISQLIGLIDALNCDIAIKKQSNQPLKEYPNPSESFYTDSINQTNLRDFFLVLKLNICYLDTVVFEFSGPDEDEAKELISNYFMQ
ncbi:HPr family phosphocarrier protein [Thorsellia anophelis]|uniref:Phosphotransferase system, HPr n=1 Tax=Thorsellia anophelis DSM 18579 TaxID=1123402 RepID=A0A1I0F6M6_9GAMM|nr:HPr family phosphocarrier protein [Thorsellia anophelis]SET53615.1 Phosphotransferase system, HPr [Thorsellia anophelis DSM 18579]